MSVPCFTLNNGVTLTAAQLAAIDELDTGIRGGPEPEDVTREKYGREIPEA
jgi:2,5-diketo-D-gluconate reductase A